MALTIPGSDNNDDDKWLSNDDIGSVDKPASPLIESSNKYLAYGQNLQNQERLDQYMAIPEEESTKDYLAYGQELKKNNAENLKNSLKIASLADAEQAAAIKELSLKTGLPPSYIQGNVGEVKRMVSLVSLDADKLAQQSPILAKQLKDPLFAAIAYDDIEHLSGIEEAAHGVSTFFRSAGSALYAVPQGTLSLIGSVPDSVDSIMSAAGIDTSEKGSLAYLPKFIGEKFAAGSKNIADRREQIKGDLSRYESDRWLTWEDVFSGIESTGMMLPGTVATMLTGNPTFMLGSAGLSMFGESYPSALEEGLPQPTALMYALTQSTTEMAFEMLPISRLLRDTKLGSGFFKTFYNQLLVEIPQEQLTTIAQEYTDFMVLPSQKDTTFGDYLKQRPESAWHTLISTLVGVAGQTSVMHYGNKLLNRVANAGIKVDPALKAMMEDEERAREALRSNEKIVELVSKIQESKMLELSPDSLKGFVRELFQSEVDGEVSDVIVYSQDIAQYAEEQGIAIEDISPLFADQVQEATENQGYFSFKVEDYLTDIALGEHGDAINQLLRVNENAMSVQEAGTWNEERNQKLMDQADAIISSMANEDKVAGDEVFNEVVRQLENIGVPRDDANQSAALYKAFFTIMGDRAGIDAKQLFDRYNLELQRNLPEGTVKANDTDTLSDLVDSILDTEISTKATVKKQTEEAGALVEKVKELKKVKEAAKDAASDFVLGDGTTKPSDEEIDAYYAENVEPAEIAQLEAEIEYERLLQSRNMGSENSIASVQRVINEKLERIARIQGVDFVEEAAPGVVESTETTVEQIEEIRAYLASEMGVDLAATDKAELLDLIRNNFYDPQGRTLDQAAWHGSAFAGVIERFSTDYIGTGEGAQAYGWGLYFATKKEVAEWYREGQNDNKLYVGGDLMDTNNPDFDAFDYLEWTPGDTIDTLLDAQAYELSRAENDLDREQKFLDGIVDGVLPEPSLDMKNPRNSNMDFIWVGKDEENTSLMLPSPKSRAYLESLKPKYMATFNDGPIDEDPFDDNGFGGLPEAKVYLVQYQEFADRYVVQARGETKDDALDAFEARVVDGTKQEIATIEAHMKTAQSYENDFIDVRADQGGLYSVELMPAEEDYLLWDNELNDQSDKVIKVINTLIKKYKLGTAGGMHFGRDVYKHLGHFNGAIDIAEEQGEWEAPEEMGLKEDERVSRFLLSQGIRGIKFKDGSSRNNDTKDATYNWVIFDDADVEITKTFNQSAVEPQGLREGEVMHFHSSPNIFDQFTIDENRLGGTYPSGIYHHGTKARTTFYGDNTYRIAVELGNVGTYFPYTPKDINQAMEDKYLEILNRYKTHVPGWAEAEARKFRKSGSMGGRFSGLEKREVWIAGGYDTIKDGQDYISFHPEAVRILEVNGKQAPPMREFFQSANEPTLEAFVAQKQGVPVPESELLTTLHGRVENELQELLGKVKGDAELLTTRRLSKIFGSPKKRKNKEKLDKNVKPIGYKDLKMMLDWAIANDSPGNWYKEFGEGFGNIVGKANLQEASILFGITSAQNAAETNFSDTLHLMALARQFNPITQEKQFRNAVRNTPRPGGQRLKITGRQIDAVVDMYQTGTYKGGLKVSTYMQLIRARGLNEFNPFSVQDVHMSRVFGYRYKDIDKDTGNVVDFAKFPSQQSIRYAMWMTNKLAEEYGIKPDAVQANLWFYAKKNLTPKKTSGKKTVVGDGTYESASNYAAPEIAAIQSLVDAGTFDKESALTTALETGERPSFTSDVKSDPFSNAAFNDQLLALAEARAPRVLVSSNPGNARGYGFPEGTTLQQLADYNQEVLAAISDEDGQIKLLREMGIVHKVGDTFGTFERVEPTFEITFPGETFKTAQFASKLLGEAMMQDGTITEKTSFDGQQFGVLVAKADGSQFSTEDLTKIYQQVNPEQSMDGLNFTRTGDGTGLKFLDGKYFEDSSKYSNKQLKEFQTQISEYFSNEGYNLELIAQESEYYDHTERSRSNRERTWNRSGIEGSSDLQRSAISSLYQPIHEVYGNWQRRLDFTPSNETSALAELLEVSESQLQAELQSETYNQQQRGSIQFRSSETIISLFEGADKSTFLHESGHLYLQIMQDLGEDPNAPDNIKEDWNKILNFLGVKSGAEIGTEQHEKWAESFEKYLFEGKAPSLELQSVFGRFKRWMMSVYKQLKNLDVEINDEIRGVFDRMLATPDEIENAENVSRLIPMFENIEQSGMTPSEWNNYQSTANAATRQAEDDLDRKKFKEEDNERKKWYREELAKTKEQVEAEVNEMPVYQAIHFLQFGEVLTGELLPGAEPMKLDKKALIEEFGQILNQLPRGRKIHANRDGVHHDMAAEIFGFASGQEMITQIMNAKPRKAFIDQVAKERMMAAYRDMRVDMTKLEEEAIKSAHMADQRSRFLHLELKALAKRASIPATPAAAARETALAMISRLTIQNLHVGKYRAAELAAARAAEKAILKENWAEAVKQKRAQLINHHLYREIEKSKEEVRKQVKFATTLDKPAAKKRLARDYIDQINTILEKLDLKQSVSKKARDRRTKFADWVEAQKNEGNELIVTEEMQKTLNSAEKTHYKDMTVAEFTEVMDTLKNIAHLAKWKQRLLDDRDKLDFDQTVDAMVDDAIDEHKQWKEQAPDFTGSKLEIFKEHWEAFSAEHDKIEYVLESMDNFKTNGIWWRNMFKPIADAADVEMEMNDKFIEQMKTIMLDRYTRKERNAWNKTVSTKKGKFNKKNIIAMALNWGNEYNRDAVIKGFEANKNWGITELDVEQILDDHMEQRDWDMVQDIWDMINELWPEVAALQKELTGVVPKKTEATPFMTKFGLMRGGYYPVSFSEKFSSQQRKRTAEQSFRELYETSPVKATTRKGSTIERTDTKDQFVRLDLDVLTEHMHDVIHDLTHRKAIMRVAKLMNNPEIQGAIEGVLGTKVYDQFEPWLKSIAAPEPNYTGRLERAANWTRHSATIVAMGFKVTTAIQQPLGYSQTGAYLGTEWAAKGLKNYLKNPVKNRDLILSKSVYMRNRTKTLDRDIRDSVKRIHAGDSKLKDMQSKYFYFIGMLDMAVSLPTWQAAYEKSLWEGMSERDAKAQGDSAVRMTQGSGEMKDMANIQKGSPTFKLFTQFYSYFSAYYGAQKRNVQMYARGEITTWQAFVQFVYLTVVPAVLSQLIVGRGPDEDEDENWAWWAAKEIMQFPAMGMIGLRDVVTVLFNPQFGTALPYTDVLDGIIRGGDSVLDLLSDDEFNKTDVKNIIVALGYALKMPGRQTANIYEHLYEVLSENEDFSLFELLVKVDRND